MAVFGRKRRSTRTAKDADVLDQPADGAAATLNDGLGEGSDPGEPGEPGGPADDGVIGTDGPYDRDQVPGIQGRLDLGSLWLVGTPGMQLRLDMDPQTGEVTSVTAMLGQSALQLQAFAAPKSEGIWAEIRSEIADSVTGQGGTAEEVAGPHGTELLTRIPARGPDGRTVHQQARFLGVDGPRWFLRGVVTGPAAVDAAQLPPLLFVLATAVVVRGAEARAPRELLPLNLPQEAAAAEDAEAGADADEPDGPHVDDFRPFDRGPEITEIR